jgi:thiamine pyrophosphate-dependent acetolactate synthase large subunit-like protein
VNALQDMVIENDGTVRNSDNNIIQFSFGDDRINPMHTDHGNAVNLDILLLKAKSLDVDKIRDEIKGVSKKEAEPKKKAPKKKAPKKKAPAKKTPSKKKKPEKITEELDEETLQKQYQKETGKNAIWRGKLTKGYKDWKNEKLG